MGQAHAHERLAAGRGAVRVGVDDELAAAAQRARRGGVHVADDHVRAKAGLQQRVGAAVDGDEDGLDVADERTQGPQVAPVVDAAHDDERGPVAEVRREARLTDLAARLVVAAAHLIRALDVARGEQLAGAPHLATADLDVLAVAQAIEEGVVGEVDEVDARLDEEQRAHVRVGVARGLAAVEDAADAGRDEVLGRDAIEALVVDDRDVARRESVDQHLRPPAEPGGAADHASRAPGGSRRRCRRDGHR